MMSYVNCLDTLSQAERLQQVGWLPAPKNWETRDVLAWGVCNPCGILECFRAAHRQQPQPSSGHLHLQEPCPNQSPNQGPQRSNYPEENQTLNAGKGGWAGSTASPPQAPDCSSLYLPLETSKGTYLSLPITQGFSALPPRTGLLGT